MTRITSIVIFVCSIVGFAAAAQAAPVLFTTSLSGDIEVPPNDSPGTGSASVTFDLDAHTMRVQAEFSNLIGTTTAAHIHGPVTEPLGTANVVTQVPYFEDFPLGVTGGSYDHLFDTLDPETYNPDFLAGFASVEEAEAALFAMLQAGTSYFNIHSTFAPGGEIRGFLEPAQVAAPAAWALVLIGLSGIGLARCRGRARPA